MSDVCKTIKYSLPDTTHISDKIYRCCIPVAKEYIRILHECEVLIEKSVPRVIGITRLCRVMPNCDLRDRFVDQYLKLIIDSFSCTPMGADT